MKKSVPSYIILAVNICAVLCLLYAGGLFLSGSTRVINPDAMLPMQDWERGGGMLFLGLVPMFVANLLGFFFCKKRWGFFLPFLIEAVLVVGYVLKSMG